MTGGPRLTRRGVLGAGLLALAACHDAAPPSHAAPPAPDAAALRRAREGELRILAAYDAAIADAGPARRAQLQVDRAVHLAHLTALGDASAQPTSTSAHRAGSRHGEIARLLGSSAQRLSELAVGAADGATAALLASVGASHRAQAAGP